MTNLNLADSRSIGTLETARCLRDDPTFALLPESEKRAEAALVLGSDDAGLIDEALLLAAMDREEWLTAGGLLAPPASTEPRTVDHGPPCHTDDLDALLERGKNFFRRLEDDEVPPDAADESALFAIVTLRAGGKETVHSYWKGPPEVVAALVKFGVPKPEHHRGVELYPDCQRLHGVKI